MIAVNSHGPTRLSISYVLATVLLAVTVWAIVQFVSAGMDKKLVQLQKLDQEKKVVEAHLKSRKMALHENEKKIELAAKLNSIITTGSGYASAMINADLHDRSVDLEALMHRSYEMKKNSDQLAIQFENIKTDDTYFGKASAIVDEALQLLTEAAHTYRIYYHSEDYHEERQREQIIRQKSREAYDKFQEANTAISFE